MMSSIGSVVLAAWRSGLVLKAIGATAGRGSGVVRQGFAHRGPLIRARSRS